MTIIFFVFAFCQYTSEGMEFNPSKCQVVQVTSSKNLINTAYTLHVTTIVNVYVSSLKWFMALWQYHSPIILNNLIEYLGTVTQRHFGNYIHLRTTINTPFFPLAIFQWNALPETVACLPDLESFKVEVSKLQHTRP